MNTNTLNQHRYSPACKSSISSDASLTFDLSELEIYGINGSVAFGLEIDKTVLSNVERKLTSTFGHDVNLTNWIEANAEKTKLSEQESADMKEVFGLIGKGGYPARNAFELAITEDGYARPTLVPIVTVAIIILGLVVGALLVVTMGVAVSGENAGAT